MSTPIRFIPVEEFRRIESAHLPVGRRMQVIADMARVNALSAVKLAGSGHLGSSFSAMDIVVWLYYAEMNTRQVGWGAAQRDVYFSSKGHDVPGLYAVLHSLGVLPNEKLVRLRRQGGLDGHPDVGVAGIEANSGSLGMGISKARGIAWAKRFRQTGGRVFVMTGDGELQEGQNYEALQSTVQQGITDLTVIVDHNKVQSDKPISEIVDLRDLQAKFEASGWFVTRCDGHDPAALERLWPALREVQDRPKAVIADTIKGKGVSFMEHPRALADGKGYYRWHAGAPDDDSFIAAHEELVRRVHAVCEETSQRPVELGHVRRDARGEPVFSRDALGEPVSRGASAPAAAGAREYVVDAYGEALLAAAADRPDLVVLDADLAADCRTRTFELAYPDRFIQNGIAEQDMVSMAGGLARHQLLPVVNSFASFLASRANEQIYNNAGEGSRIIYVCHYAGLIPAGPGKSHQSLRDISLFANIPNVTIVQPGNADETRQAVDYAVGAAGNVVLRLAIGPSPRTIACPPDYVLTHGRGWVVRDGDAAILFAYGPVMLHEALLAAEQLDERGIAAAVINQPWLNVVDEGWLADVVRGDRPIFVVEDHGSTGGLGDFLLRTLVKQNLLGARPFAVFGVDGPPACGTPAEALAAHALDGESIARRVTASIARVAC